MKKVILLGTSHSIQRGENSPGQFRSIIEEEYGNSNFLSIAEEIEKDSTYIAETFCNDNQLKYLCMDPDQQERRDRGIPSANEIIIEIIDEFDEEYPEICIWPPYPSQETLPSEVWRKYSERTESSYRDREAVWLERLTALNIWPILCICGANHFSSFSKLMLDAGLQVTELHNDWEPI